ncbi:MAG: type II toxin-antitoxin system RelE/ParE family toxin [Candidatus Peregrinibacteria bacterium]
MYKIFFHPKAEQELLSLKTHLSAEATKEIDALSENPFRGKPLHGELRTCRKIYFHHKKMRIVYRLEGNTVHIEEVKSLEIIAIGERKQEKVYKIALKRLLEGPCSGEPL